MRLSRAQRNDDKADKPFNFPQTPEFVLVVSQVGHKQEGPPIGGAVRNATSLIPQRLSYMMLAVGPLEFQFFAVREQKCIIGCVRSP